jgi:hypothetical protein
MRPQSVVAPTEYDQTEIDVHKNAGGGRTNSCAPRLRSRSAGYLAVAHTEVFAAGLPAN